MSARSSRVVVALVIGLAPAFAPAAVLAQSYRHPSNCQNDCMTVSAYRDHGGRTDWNCGGITYGGHGGTDFATYGGWGAVDEGRDVVAVAEGTVVEAHDGEFDRCTSGACSGGGGWGNYVAIQHPDGVITYYAHQRTGSIAVGVGDWVGCGQHLGFIASSGSSTGPHLHFEPRTGGPGSGLEPFGFGACSDPATRWIDQGPYAGLPGTSCPVTDRPPEGWIDEASCEHVYGWAIDPDDGGAAIGVYVNFDGPLFDPAATAGYETRADLGRLDVGPHGFELVVPLRYMDGREHGVWAYGLGLAGGAGAHLSGSPRTFRCEPPSPPFVDGVRRHVTSPESFAAWHFDPNDILRVDDATLDRYPASDDWPAAPALIAAEGDPGVHLRDSRAGRASRRHVPSPEAMARWRLDWGAIANIPLAELTSLEPGQPISVRPYLVQGSGPAVYVIDAPAPTPVSAPLDAGSTGDAGPASADGGGATVDAGASDGDASGRAGEGGGTIIPAGRVSGSCQVGLGRGTGSTALLLALGLACVAWRRRR